MGEMNKDVISIDVGRRLRMLREERRISMRALARASGLSANALSMIERGLTSPSVNTLTKLAYALETPVTALFRKEPARQKVVFCKASERIQTPFVQGLWEDMRGETFGGRLEPYVLTLEGGGSSGVHGTIHTGQEFVFCMQGVLEYEVDQKLYVMEPGDRLIFESHLQHRWRNSADAEVKALIVICSFEEDEHPGEFHLISSAVPSTRPTKD